MGRWPRASGALAASFWGAGREPMGAPRRSASAQTGPRGHGLWACSQRSDWLSWAAANWATVGARRRSGPDLGALSALGGLFVAGLWAYSPRIWVALRQFWASSGRSAWALALSAALEPGQILPSWASPRRSASGSGWPRRVIKNRGQPSARAVSRACSQRSARAPRRWASLRIGPIDRQWPRALQARSAWPVALGAWRLVLAVWGVGCRGPWVWVSAGLGSGSAGQPRPRPWSAASRAVARLLGLGRGAQRLARP